jgi:hypothetical protein
MADSLLRIDTPLAPPLVSRIAPPVTPDDDIVETSTSPTVVGEPPLLMRTSPPAPLRETPPSTLTDPPDAEPNDEPAAISTEPPDETRPEPLESLMSPPKDPEPLERTTAPPEPADERD